jgi:hypothetical protein
VATLQRTSPKLDSDWQIAERREPVGPGSPAIRSRGTKEHAYTHERQDAIERNEPATPRMYNDKKEKKWQRQCLHQRYFEPSKQRVYT